MALVPGLWCHNTFRHFEIDQCIWRPCSVVGAKERSLYVNELFKHNKIPSVVALYANDIRASVNNSCTNGIIQLLFAEAFSRFRTCANVLLHTSFYVDPCDLRYSFHEQNR